MHNYPSDISREEFEIIKEELEGAKKKTKPRKTDLYDVLCAVLYVVKCYSQLKMSANRHRNLSIRQELCHK